MEEAQADSMGEGQDFLTMKYLTFWIKARLNI